MPKKKGLYLLTSSDGSKYKDNPKYFFQYLQKKGLNAYWATTNKNVYQELKSKNMPVSYIYSIKHFLYALRAEFVFSDDSRNGVFFDSIFWHYGNFKNILMWHGTGFKNIGLKAEKYQKGNKLINYIKYALMKSRFKSYKLILASSEFDKKRKKDCFKNSNVEVLGYPRIDYLVESAKKKSLNKNKIILYLPTFREKDSENRPFSRIFLKKLDEYLEKSQQKLLIKNHPYDKICKLYKGQTYHNILDITNKGKDVQDLLIDSDLLITDYSSVCCDYVVLDKPVIFYIYDYDHYTSNCRNTYYSFTDTVPGPFARDETSLLKMIQNQSWFINKEYKEKYLNFKSSFHKFTDSNSSKRILEYIRNKL
ncbi:MAG: putative CDP-glycerol:glycerophosphate glycerophosphotransferase [bacterium ADurb.Bin212]|nr:MAG: putative CDP-glycerol:glycerophosphate glycerophosphotransferase [bacterium ADurb.Bin212]